MCTSSFSVSFSPLVLIGDEVDKSSSVRGPLVPLCTSNSDGALAAITSTRDIFSLDDVVLIDGTETLSKATSKSKSIKDCSSQEDESDRASCNIRPEVSPQRKLLICCL